MTGLIERLRFLGKRRREQLILADIPPTDIPGDWIIEWQAADRIEQLEAAARRAQELMNQSRYHAAEIELRSILSEDRE